jgi:hypothetical protein
VDATTKALVDERLRQRDRIAHIARDLNLPARRVSTRARQIQAKIHGRGRPPGSRENPEKIQTRFIKRYGEAAFKDFQEMTARGNSSQVIAGALGLQASLVRYYRPRLFPTQPDSI